MAASAEIPRLGEILPGKKDKILFWVQAVRLSGLVKTGLYLAGMAEKPQGDLDRAGRWLIDHAQPSTELGAKTVENVANRVEMREE